ncbi:hypothetical protein H4R23_001505 [Coemansia sp. Cherry 401B]|nr:hypothetical protein H4R23_001505 [Coemansia sp. Cherry 401B]
MRPDPYKQKASRRYQAAHRDAAAKPPTPNSTVKDAPPPPEHKAGGKFSRRKIQDNAWRYEEMSLESTEGAHLDSLEAAEAREEEYVQEFLNHLDEKTQNIGTEQSAAYFQLRAEAASADLSAYNENVWKDLTKVDWEELVDTASSTPLHKLFGVDENTPLPDGVASTLVDKNDALLQNKPAQQNIQAPPLQSKSQPGTHIASTMLSAAELAPGISAANATNDSAAYSGIDAVIARFSSVLNTPRFSPHLTLFSPIRADTDQAALEQVAAYVEHLRKHQLADIGVDISGLATGNKFHQCVLLEAATASSGLSTANAVARQHWDSAGQPPYRPHVSLVYGDYHGSELENLKLQVERELPNDPSALSFATTQILVVETSGSCEQWYSAGSVHIDSQEIFLSK